jgi:hypothetical protein
VVFNQKPVGCIRKCIRPVFDLEKQELRVKGFQEGRIKAATAIFVRTALDRQRGYFIFLIRSAVITASGAAIILTKDADGPHARVGLQLFESDGCFGPLSQVCLAVDAAYGIVG